MRRIVVVGGGVFGLTGALALRERGWEVVIVEPGPIPHPGASSTDISKAIRMDYGADDFYTDLAAESLAGWDAWNRAWRRPLYHETGVVFMSREAMAPGGFEHESFVRLSRRGFAPVRLDGTELAARFPAWNAELYADGYFNPRGGWAESARVVERLLEEARAQGIVVREGDRVVSLNERGSQVAGVLVEKDPKGARTERSLVQADMVLVAAGAWTPELLPWLQDVIRPVAQTVLHFRPEDPSLFLPPRFTVWGADISRTGWYGFPANSEGIVKIANHGPGLQQSPSGPRALEPDAESHFRTFLRGTFPALADAPLAGGRVCFYEDAFDGNFLIDHDPERPGLVVASGGSGHGFKFAPILGEIIANVVEQIDDPRAARFRWRARGMESKEGARNA